MGGWGNKIQKKGEWPRCARPRPVCFFISGKKILMRWGLWGDRGGIYNLPTKKPAGTKTRNDCLFSGCVGRRKRFYKSHRSQKKPTSKNPPPPQLCCAISTQPPSYVRLVPTLPAHLCIYYRAKRRKRKFPPFSTFDHDFDPGGVFWQFVGRLGQEKE